MFDAVANDFPFVAELPKREKSKVVKVWESFQELARISETEGVLIPVSFAAKVLDVSRQRIDELIAGERMKCYLVNGHRFVSENSVVEYAKGERKAGRPVGKFLDSMGSDFNVAAKCALEAGRGVLKNSRK